MIKVHCILSSLFNQSPESAKRVYHRPFRCPTFINLCNIYVSSRAAQETVLGPVFSILAGNQGTHSLWIVSKDRRAKGCRLSCLCCPLIASFHYPCPLEDVCQIQAPWAPVICVSFRTFNMIWTGVFIC